MMWPRARMLLQREKKKKPPKASRADLLAMIHDLADENDKLHTSREGFREAMVSFLDLDRRIDEGCRIRMDIDG